MNLVRLRLGNLISSVGRYIVLSGLFLGALISMRAENVVVTVKGTVVSGGDQYGLFKIGKDLKGQDFTFVFTFDRSLAKKGKDGSQCAYGADSDVAGTNPSAPATGVLTIGNGSFTFGERSDTTWGAGRLTSSICISIHEGQYPQSEGIDLSLIPARDQRMSNSPDWHAPANDVQYSDEPRFGHFVIVRSRDFEHVTMGTLIVKSVTVQ
jgi:hypothetical protein